MPNTKGRAGGKVKNANKTRPRVQTSLADTTGPPDTEGSKGAPASPPSTPVSSKTKSKAAVAPPGPKRGRQRVRREHVEHSSGDDQGVSGQSSGIDSEDDRLALKRRRRGGSRRNRYIEDEAEECNSHRGESEEEEEEEGEDQDEDDEDEAEVEDRTGTRAGADTGDDDRLSVVTLSDDDAPKTPLKKQTPKEARRAALDDLGAKKRSKSRGATETALTAAKDCIRTTAVAGRPGSSSPTVPARPVVKQEPVGSAVPQSRQEVGAPVVETGGPTVASPGEAVPTPCLGTPAAATGSGGPCASGTPGPGGSPGSGPGPQEAPPRVLPEATNVDAQRGMLGMLLSIARSASPPSVKTSTFGACASALAGTPVLQSLQGVPEWDKARCLFTGPPDWDAVCAVLTVVDESLSRPPVSTSPGGLQPTFPGQALSKTLEAAAPKERDPVPTGKYPTNVQLKPCLRGEGETLGGLGYVVIVTALSHCVWTLQFVERVDGVAKSVFTGTRQHSGTIGCALSCMTPSWYKSKTRQGVRGDVSTNDEWFWYRVWLECSKENMEKLVGTLRKNLTDGANQVRARKTKAGDWQDRRNRDTWLRDWSFEINNDFDETTQAYVPKPWDVQFTNSSIRSLTSGRFTIFAGLSPDQLIAAGGFFSPSSPYTLKMILDGEWDETSEKAGELHISFKDDDE